MASSCCAPFMRRAHRVGSTRCLRSKSCRVDGGATVGHVIDGVTVAGAAVEPSVCSMALWRLAVEGFVLFQVGIEH